jgi:hypothetical protein
LIRGHKVMIDVDLAGLYEVPTKRLNEQVQRNRKRFPEDFMFQLKKEEAESLRSQFATSKTSRGAACRNLTVHDGRAHRHHFCSDALSK